MAMSAQFTGADQPLHMDAQVAFAAWADEVQPLVTDALKAEAPVSSGPNASPNPGRMRNSIRAERKAGAGSLTMTFLADGPIPGYVIDGTKPHEIWGRGGGSLAFMYGNQLVFRKMVHHPGTSPNPFPTRAIAPLLSLIEQRLAAAIADHLSA